MEGTKRTKRTKSKVSISIDKDILEWIQAHDKTSDLKVDISGICNKELRFVMIKTIEMERIAHDHIEKMDKIKREWQA